MTTATRTKKKRIGSERPPQEIRDNTKLRRAWLADKLAEINALPNREGKIVDKGSYQSISVYEVTEVAGRLRHRGICQYCGHQQVVWKVLGNNKIVLHGYTRPGDGYIFGRCPGTELVCLNESDTATKSWLEQSKIVHETAVKVKRETGQELEEATEAVYGESSTQTDEVRALANRLYPKTPQLGYGQKLTFEQEQELKTARKAWADNFPVMAAYYDAKRDNDAARNSLWVAKSGVRHFQGLIDAGYYGTPLAEEIVA